MNEVTERAGYTLSEEKYAPLERLTTVYDQLTRMVAEQGDDISEAFALQQDREKRDALRIRRLLENTNSTEGFDTVEDQEFLRESYEEFRGYLEKPALRNWIATYTNDVLSDEGRTRAWKLRLDNLGLKPGDDALCWLGEIESIELTFADQGLRISQPYNGHLAIRYGFADQEVEQALLYWLNFTLSKPSPTEPQPQVRCDRHLKFRNERFNAQFLKEEFAAGHYKPRLAEVEQLEDLLLQPKGEPVTST